MRAAITANVTPAAALETAVSEDDKQSYLDINKRIHLIQAEAAGNRFLSNQINIVYNISRRFWYSSISDTESFALAAGHHANTLRAIASGDETSAVTHNNALLDFLEKVTKDAIAELHRR